jgi:hypothetical protein
MPDGTLVKNVPDNITQADLAARFDAFKAQVATPVPSEIPQAPVTGPEGAPIPSILQTQTQPKEEMSASKAAKATVEEVGGIARRLIADPALGLAKGVINAEEFLVGLGDILTGGRAGKIQEETMKERGMPSPQQMKDFLTSLQSPERIESVKKVAEAKGFGPTALSLIENPAALSEIVESSLPSMAASQVGLGRYLLPKVAPKMGAVSRGAVGEATVQAGSMAEQVRQQNEDRLLTPEQSAISVVSGVLTGAQGLLGGKVAQKLGLQDVDTLLAGGVSNDVKRNILTTAFKSALAESAFEEMPQSVQEQISQNIALGRSPLEGVAEAGAAGALAGFATAGGITGVSQFQQNRRLAKAAQPTPPPVSERIEPEVTPREPVVEVGQPTIVPSPELEAYDKEIAKAQPTETKVSETSHDTQAMMDELSGKSVEYIPEPDEVKAEAPKAIEAPKEEPTGAITEEEKEFTPVGGRLISKADADKLARESAIALEQNLATQEVEKEKQLKQEIREEKFREPITQTLSARLVQEGGIARSQKRDMLGETGKISGYDHVFRENGGDLLTMVKDGLLDDYLPPNIRSTATPPDGLFDARPGYNYISDLIGTGEKVHHYDYEMAKLQHENIVAEKNLAKQYMEPNEAARAAAAEEQEKEYMNVAPTEKVIPTPSEAKFHEEAKNYVSEAPAYKFDSEAPSFKIEMNKLRRKIKQGSVTQEEVIPAIEEIYQSTKKEKPILDRQRGAAIIKEKLLAAKRRKELSPEMVDMAEWFINQNPDLVKDLAVSIRANNRDGVAGGYLPLSKLAKIFKYSPNDTTAVHEILHHTERMMPKDIQEAIRNAWSKSLQRDAEKAFGGKNEALKQYYRDVIDFHYEGKMEAEARAMQLLADNVIGNIHYKNFNPSEFWAVKGSDIVQGRYKANISDSIVVKIKNWLKEFIETVKGIFNISDDAAVIKALNSLAKSDGKFITDMIHEGEEALGLQNPQVDTPAFKKWFGNSKVVNPDGSPRVMYHGTKQDIDEFKSQFQLNKEKYGESANRLSFAYGLGGIYFTPNPNYANRYARTDLRKTKEKANVIPVYLRMENPYVYPNGIWADLREKFLNPIDSFLYSRAVRKNIKEKGFPDAENIKSMQVSRHGYMFARINEVNKLKAKGYDGIISPDGNMFIVFEPNQIKSAIGNQGTYSLDSNKIYANIGGKPKELPKNFKGQEVLPQWHGPEESKIDTWIYRLQNKQIDTKRVQALIGDIEENWNVYDKEQLYHGRTASGIRNFLLKDLLPVIKDIERLKISPEEVRTYLHNRHAEERNIQMNKINPDIYDPKTGRTTPNPLKDKGSGISTADAKAYLAGLDPAKKQTLENIANKFDQMVKGTQQILINSGAESADTIAKWNKTYKHYVPLFRVEDEMARPSGLGGTGQGFGTRGNFSKRAMGSEKDVQDILSNIIAQRERALIRAEKIRVGRALYGLAIQSPNPDFWMPINPDAIKSKKQAVAELRRMGIPDAEDVVNNLMREPQERYLRKVQVAEGGIEPEDDFDFDSGLPVNESKEVVASKVNVMARYKDFVFPVRINGKDRYIFFNKNDPRALRMVQALKNLDVENLGWAVGIAGKFTRWFKNVNTQYNPVFGLVNFIRDSGGALLNLTNTEIAGEQVKVLAGAYKAMGGILNVHRAERKGKPPSTGPWATLYQDARTQGFQTGYRDSLIRNQEEMQIIEHTLEQFKDGNTKKAFYSVLGGLTDFNDMMENSIRLSAYKVALDKGLSKQKAAIIAKNLTVNFDKKGAWTAQVNALYAFFNASIQGTERIYRTITGPKGKIIIGGGILAGMVQAVMLAAAGYDDDDPPEFVREKNFIIPLADGTYFTVPYPLGYNVLPSSGRIVMEFMLHGGKNPGKHIASLTSAVINSVNPLGSSGLATQTLMPTVIDPLIAFGENKDSFGRPISREDRATSPTPGYSRSRETSTALGKGIAEFLNWASGGDKYVKGRISPTGDDVDFLAGQVGGGLYREISKAAKAVGSTITGEEIPAYRRPIVGRFIGETGSNASISQTFYENVTRLTDHENTIKGLRKDKLPTDSYKAKNPEARLWPRANSVENEVNAINKQKRMAIEKNKPKEVIQRLDEKKARIMKQFNDQVKKVNAD